MSAIAQQEVLAVLSDGKLASLPEIIVEAGLPKDIVCNAVVELHEAELIRCRPGPRRPVYSAINLNENGSDL